MQILICNDDGVHAAGIKALYTAISAFTAATVVAPDSERSASSHAITIKNPISYKEMDNGFYAVDGTPADCVYLGLKAIMTAPPKMLLSGINHGSNLGDDTIYSGTVAAAVEARYLGIPSVAFSLGGECKHFNDAAQIAAQFVKHLLRYPPADDMMFNVNIPDLPLSQIKGFKVCRLGRRHPSHNIIEQKTPGGKQVFWIGDVSLEVDGGEGTDFAAVKDGYVSVTPLDPDLTKYSSIEAVEHWMVNIETESV